MKTIRVSPSQAVVLAVSVLALASLACSAVVRSTPATPGEANTPGPASPMPLALTKAKAGHWEGTPSVSFDVAANGDIRNFKLISFIGTVRCTVEVEKIPAQADGSFTYTALIKEDNYWPGGEKRLADAGCDRRWPHGRSHSHRWDARYPDFPVRHFQNPYMRDHSNHAGRGQRNRNVERDLEECNAGGLSY